MRNRDAHMILRVEMIRNLWNFQHDIDVDVFKVGSIYSPVGRPAEGID